VIVLVTSATRTTCIAAGTHLMYMFYVGESDSCGNGNTVRVEPFETVTEAVEDAISTIGAEMSELDKIGFDEMINVDDSDDLPYKLDAE
jgi:hypothetical protein